MKASRWIAAAAVLLVVAVAVTHAQEAAPAPVPADPEVQQAPVDPQAKPANTFGSTKARIRSPSGTNGTHHASGRRPHAPGKHNSTSSGSRRPSRNSTGHHAPPSAVRASSLKTRVASIAETVDVPDDKVEVWKSAVLLAWLKEAGVYDLYNGAGPAAPSAAALPATVALEQERAAAALAKLDAAVGGASASQLRNAIVLSWLKDTGALDLLDKLKNGTAPASSAVPELARATPPSPSAAAPAAAAPAAAAPAKANATSALDALKAAVIIGWANDGGVAAVMKHAAALRAQLQGAVSDAGHTVDGGIRAASVAIGGALGGGDKAGRKARGGDKVRAAALPAEPKLGDKKQKAAAAVPGASDLFAGARKQVLAATDAIKKFKLPQLPRRARAASVAAPAGGVQASAIKEVPLRSIGGPVAAASTAAAAEPAAADAPLCSARPAESRQACYNSFALKLAAKLGAQLCSASDAAAEQDCINAFVGQAQRRKGSIASCERAAPENKQACVNAWLESQMKAEAGVAAEGPAATAGATAVAEAVPAEAAPVATA